MSVSCDPSTQGFPLSFIHGEMDVEERRKRMRDFRNGNVRVMISTDLLARGIDVQQVSLVINYELPTQKENYIHRIGRTGRAGASGEAISFVAWGDFKNLCAIESRLNHIIKRKEIDGFPVRKIVPVSILNYVRKSQPPQPKTTHRTKSKPSSHAPDRNTNNGPATRQNKHIWGGNPP